MRFELTQLFRTGFALFSLTLLSTVFVAGCSEPSALEPAPATSPADNGAPDADGSGSQDSGGSSTQSGGGSSSR